MSSPSAEDAPSAGRRKRVLIVSPVRNEAEHIAVVARGMQRQTRPPDVWLVVDDGSEDQTPELVRGLAEEISFMHALATPARFTQDDGDRLRVAAEARAFNWALGTVELDDFDYIGKLDGDIELPDDYFERLLEEFDKDAELGIGGGALVELVGSEWRTMKTALHHVRGALKLYRHECFSAIGGVRELLGWDGIDQTYAQMRGYKTRSFTHIVARHLRPCGSADGVLRGRVRHGEVYYVLGFSLPWTAMKSLKYAARRPPVASGAAFLYGYLRSSWRSLPRVEDLEYRRFVRITERERLREAVQRLRPDRRFSSPTATES
jgi:glycosyltransferase involved in cell wall biosynthesis